MGPGKLGKKEATASCEPHKWQPSTEFCFGNVDRKFARQGMWSCGGPSGGGRSPEPLSSSSSFPRVPHRAVGKAGLLNLSAPLTMLWQLSARDVDRRLVGRRSRPLGFSSSAVEGSASGMATGSMSVWARVVVEVGSAAPLLLHMSSSWNGEIFSPAGDSRR